MPAPLPRPWGTSRAHSGRAGSPRSGQPSRRPQEWRQLPGKVAPKPPATGHSASSTGPSLPSFPPSLPREVERRGAGRRALSRLGSPDRPSRARGASRGLAQVSPLLQGREAPLPGEPERLVRLAQARSVSCLRLSGFCSYPRLRGLTLSPTRPASNQEAAAAASSAKASRRQAPSSQQPRAGSRAFRSLGAWRAAGGLALLSVSSGAHATPGSPALPALTALRALLATGSGWALWAGGYPRCRPKRVGLVAQPEQTPEARETGPGRAGGQEEEQGTRMVGNRPRPPSHGRRCAGDPAGPSGRGPGQRRVHGGEVPFANLYRDGSSQVQLGPILFVRLSCRE